MADRSLRRTVTILGAGSWGTAFARYLDSLGHRVHLWEYDPDSAMRLGTTRQITDKLPGIHLPTSVEVSHDLDATVASAEVVVFATPSTAIRPTARRLASLLTDPALLVCLTKGIEIETGARMTEIIIGETGLTSVVALLGPSHAEEVARDVPTAMVAASSDTSAAQTVQYWFSSNRLRIYTSEDPVGVELAAALKNIVAIAAGIVDGLGFESADNLKGALLTRGLAEITRLGVKMGARPETFAGLSGVGDLVTTCLSRHSRNRHVGEQVGRGRKLDDVLAEMTMVAEGVTTTKAALRLAEQHGVEMPIARAVSAVLFDGRPAKSTLMELMARPPQPEIRR